jgi:hypothetical protein
VDKQQPMSMETAVGKLLGMHMTVEFDPTVYAGLPYVLCSVRDTHSNVLLAMGTGPTPLEALHTGLFKSVEERLYKLAKEMKHGEPERSQEAPLDRQ